MMKSVTVFVIFGLFSIAVAAPFTDDQIQKAQNHVKECLEELNMDPSTAQKLKDGDFSVDDEKVQCFAFCVLRKAGFVDSNGDQKIDVISKKLSVNKDKDQVAAAIELCKDVKGSSPCNKAYEAFRCYHGLL